MNVAMNKKGYLSFDEVKANGLRGLSIAEFELLAEENEALILDTRNPNEFWKGFIPNSVNIGINGDFAPWVGAMITDVKQSILLVVEEGKEEEVVKRLSRVGFDEQLGYLSGGFEAWKAAGKDFDKVKRITSEEFSTEFKEGTTKVIDVRKEGEYAAEHVEEAYSYPLAYINDWIRDINPEEHFYLHCAGGYRSMIAASILQARGFRNFSEIEGGFGAISNTIIPKTNFVCQSKVFK
jgi:rhodanese-related sulfurtransferase